jgi:hypothetical protein
MKLIIMSLLLLAVVILPITTTGVYGQIILNNTNTTTTTTATAPAIVVADQQVLNDTYFHEYVLDDLEQAELISVQAFENGMMILVFKLQDENERRMVIRTQSPITPEAGYHWDNGTIYTPEGRKLVFELGGER